MNHLTTSALKGVPSWNLTSRGVAGAAYQRRDSDGVAQPLSLAMLDSSALTRCTVDVPTPTCGDPANAHARCEASADRRLDLVGNSRTAEPHALGSRPHQPGIDPFPDHRPLKLGEHAHDAEER